MAYRESPLFGSIIRDWAFFMPKGRAMNEEEYEDYLRQVESLSQRSADVGEKSLLEQL
jgi:hypothetical protein